jgi:hypothetical protein
VKTERGLSDGDVITITQRLLRDRLIVQLGPVRAAFIPQHILSGPVCDLRVLARNHWILKLDLTVRPAAQHHPVFPDLKAFADQVARYTLEPSTWSHFSTPYPLNRSPTQRNPEFRKRNGGRS